jgi:hypothetical protein
MTREPIGKTGAKSEGTWKLSADGFCTTWKGSKENCFRVQATGDKKMVDHRRHHRGRLLDEVVSYL